MIVLYHGTILRLEQPLACVGREDLDFGKGFYLTRLRDQAAWRYAGREAGMREQVLWRKVARIIMRLAERLQISPERALAEIFLSL